MADTDPFAPQQDELLASHNYDGIQEYDNPTPGWWNWLFIGSIAFAPIYIFWFHSPVVERNLAGRYKEAYAANLKLQFGDMEDYGSPRANIVHYMHDDRWLAVGAAVFTTNCKSCHGAEGEGISGPNMTDNNYINIKQIEDIAKVVTNGAKNGAMPAWQSRLTDKEILVVSAYVASLRGENLQSSRPTEGDVIDPWPTVAEVSDGAAEKNEAADKSAPADQTPADSDKPAETA